MTMKLHFTFRMVQFSSFTSKREQTGPMYLPALISLPSSSQALETDLLHSMCSLNQMGTCTVLSKPGMVRRWMQLTQGMKQKALYPLLKETRCSIGVFPNEFY